MIGYPHVARRRAIQFQHKSRRDQAWRRWFLICFFLPRSSDCGRCGLRSREGRSKWLPIAPGGKAETVKARQSGSIGSRSRPGAASGRGPSSFSPLATMRRASPGEWPLQFERLRRVGQEPQVDFCRRRQNDRHRLGMNWGDDGIRFCRRKPNNSCCPSTGALFLERRAKGVHRPANANKGRSLAEGEPLRRLGRLGVGVFAKRGRGHDAAVLLAEPAAPVRAADLSRHRCVAHPNRPLRANTGHSPTARRMDKIDP